MTYRVSKATDITLNRTEGNQQPEPSDLSSTATAGVRPVQTRLSCLLEGLSPEQRDQARIETLRKLGLQGTESLPILDEATQTVARSLAMPICALSVMSADTQQMKSVVGLSNLGLMNPLAAARSIPRSESFCTHVIDSGKTFALEDTTAHLIFSRSLLVQQYGIQSYLGVPLISSEGICIGTLAVMDLLPHSFTQQEVALLEMTARWCMSEIEKQHLNEVSHQSDHPPQPIGIAPSGNPLLSKINQVRSDLVVQLTQDLRSPLTSITGMANMLSREIYGPLSEKQQEYTKIVLDSSQHLLAMVDEIVAVGGVQEEGYQLNAATIDVEMVGQQAISSLEGLAKQQDLEIKLTVEPSSRLWNLDKGVIKQLIYHLVFSITKMSTAGSTIRLHISRKDDSLNIALWVSNPWLGEDLPQAVISWDKTNTPLAATSSDHLSNPQDNPSEDILLALATAQKVDTSRQELGLLLSRYLAEIHGGEAAVQGSAAAGYRYVITLPSIEVPN